MAATARMPWEFETESMRCRAAEDWLKEQGRSVDRVYQVEWWAVFYVSTAGEARHQGWRIDSKDKLVLDGPHKSGWPAQPKASSV